MDGRREGKKTVEESRFGRGLWPTLALAALAALACAAILIQVSKRDESASAWAIMLCLGAMLFAPAIALFAMNAPKFWREWSAAKEPPIDGIGFDGMPVEVEEFEGSLWADAGQAAAALGEDPRVWPLKFAQAGEGALRREGKRMWARRDAWGWRCSREKDLGLRRLRSRLEADGFGVHDRLAESERMGRELRAFEATQGEQDRLRSPGPSKAPQRGGAGDAAGSGAAAAASKAGPDAG